VLPSLAAPVWDTSSLISNSSLIGKALTGMVGYDARPAGMQIAFYLAVLVVVWLGMGWAKRRSQAPRTS
jgi:high-affinity iron transporter